MINSLDDVLKGLAEITKFLEQQNQLGVLSGDDFNTIACLMDSDEWPVAVLPEAISMSEEDKVERADLALDTYDMFYKGKKFLDFGCGEGHTVRAATKRGALAFGYDIKQQWEDDSPFLTTDWSHIYASRPFDMIMMYDVLDHVDDPQKVLEQVASVLSNTGQLFVRCHPWCSRHGTHLYKQKNKAFVHLFFNDMELDQLGLKNEKVHMVIHPLDTYQDWFRKHFLVKKMEKTVQPVEKFFKDNPLLYKRVMHHWRNSPDGHARTWPEWQLSLSFVDYWLGLKRNNN